MAGKEMTSIVILALDGILQSDGGHPIQAGCRLYRTLRSTLTCQAGCITSLPETAARRFFDQEHMPAPAFLRSEIPATPGDWEKECRQIRRGYPYEIDWIAVPDPAIAGSLYYEGFRVLLWTDPRYSRPEHRPDAPPHQASSWAALAGGLREDKNLIAADERIR